MRYHPKYCVKFLRKYSGDSTLAKENAQQMCIERDTGELRLDLMKGAVNTLLGVWDRYSQLLFEFQIDTGSYKAYKTLFKNKLHSQVTA